MTPSPPAVASPPDGPSPGAAGARRVPRRWLAVPVVAVALAVGVTVALVTGGGPDRGSVVPSTGTSGDDPADAAPAPVEVVSDAPRYTSLDDLVAASDLVVEGEVVSSVEGRWFGAPAGDAGAGAGAGGQRILSRLVTIRIERVLTGEAPSTGTVLVEEEGWTADGAPLVVDGLAAAAVGDRGVWFLVDGGDPEVGAYVLVNAQGRYLERAGRLEGAAGEDQLVAELSARSSDALASAVSAAPAPTAAESSSGTSSGTSSSPPTSAG